METLSYGNIFNESVPVYIEIDKKNISEFERNILNIFLSRLPKVISDKNQTYIEFSKNKLLGILDIDVYELSEFRNILDTLSLINVLKDDSIGKHVGSFFGEIEILQNFEIFRFHLNNLAKEWLQLNRS